MLKHIRSLLIAALLGFGILAPTALVAQTSYFYGVWGLAEGCGTGATPSTSNSTPSTSDTVNCEDPNLHWADKLFCGIIIGPIVDSLSKTKFTLFANRDLRVELDDGEESWGRWSYGSYRLSMRSGGGSYRVKVESAYPDRFVAVDESSGEEVTFWKCQ